MAGACRVFESHGTSPRTRGKRLCLLRFRGWRRNIPAHAGKTWQNIGGLVTKTEHPRARGENRRPRQRVLAASGTSPRTRGKRVLFPQTPAPVRNIPAHAGKTLPILVLSRFIWEHPRARGENRVPVILILMRCGTSPRTRGKLVNGKREIGGTRNIPAHAGKTLIDVRFLVPEGHFTFGFIFPHHGGVKFILS